MFSTSLTPPVSWCTKLGPISTEAVNNRSGNCSHVGCESDCFEIKSANCDIDSAASLKPKPSWACGANVTRLLQLGRRCHPCGLFLSSVIDASHDHLSRSRCHTPAPSMKRFAKYFTTVACELAATTGFNKARLPSNIVRSDCRMTSVCKASLAIQE